MPRKKTKATELTPRNAFELMAWERMVCAVLTRENTEQAIFEADRVFQEWAVRYRGLSGGSKD